MKEPTVYRCVSTPADCETYQIGVNYTFMVDQPPSLTHTVESEGPDDGASFELVVDEQ